MAHRWLRQYRFLALQQQTTHKKKLTQLVQNFMAGFTFTPGQRVGSQAAAAQVKYLSKNSQAEPRNDILVEFDSETTNSQLAREKKKSSTKKSKPN